MEIVLVKADIKEDIKEQKVIDDPVETFDIVPLEIKLVS
jgi:hypothetical protein